MRIAPAAHRMVAGLRKDSYTEFMERLHGEGYTLPLYVYQPPKFLPGTPLITPPKFYLPPGSIL